MALIDYSDIMSRDRLKEEVKDLMRGENKREIRGAGLIATLYMTAARISELVMGKLKPEHLEVNQIDGNRFLIFKIQTLKNPSHPLRKIPVHIEKNRAFVDALKKQMKSNPTKPSGPIFPFTRQHGYDLTKEYLGVNPHQLRHYRITHLASKGFSDQQLKKIAGWSDTRPSSVYSHIKWKGNAKLMAEKDV